MNNLSRRLFYVLIADDSFDDRFLLRKAIIRTGHLKILAEVSDGHELICYLEDCLKVKSLNHKGRNRVPDLLLLDLKMPRKNGFEVLQWLREQSLVGIMVVVLTDSMEPRHIKKALDLGADLFEIKPRGTNERVAMMLALEDYLVQASMSLHRHLTISPAA